MRRHITTPPPPPPSLLAGAQHIAAEPGAQAPLVLPAESIAWHGMARPRPYRSQMQPRPTPHAPRPALSLAQYETARVESLSLPARKVIHGIRFCVTPKNLTSCRRRRRCCCFAEPCRLPDTASATASGAPSVSATQNASLKCLLHLHEHFLPALPPPSSLPPPLAITLPSLHPTPPPPPLPPPPQPPASIPAPDTHAHSFRPDCRLQTVDSPWGCFL